MHLASFFGAMKRVSEAIEVRPGHIPKVILPPHWVHVPKVVPARHAAAIPKVVLARVPMPPSKPPPPHLRLPKPPSKPPPPHLLLPRPELKMEDGDDEMPEP